MQLTTQNLLDIKVGGLFGISQVSLNPLTVYVANAGSYFYNEIQAFAPLRLFTTLADAQAALPTATYASPIPATIVFTPGTYTVTAKQVLGINRTGTNVVFMDGATLTTATALSAGDGVLEVEGRYIKVVNPTITTTQASQTGTALIVGGSEAAEGDGYGVQIIGGTTGSAYVSTAGSVSGALTTSNDFASNLMVRGASDVVVKGLKNYAFTATTKIIDVQAAANGNGTATPRNGLRLVLDEVYNHAKTDSGNTCVPLAVASGQDDGTIINSRFINYTGTGKSITLAANNWTLASGLATTNAAIAAKSHVNLTGTGINIGAFYVKASQGSTAATLLDQTNV